MNQKLTTLIFCLISFTVVVSSMYAISWIYPSKPQTTLELYVYNSNQINYYQKLSKLFSETNKKIEVQVITKLDETPIIGVSLDNNAIPILKPSKKNILPIAFDGNGIIYFKNIFEKNGITVPSTFREFEQVCSKLNEIGITPFQNNLENPQETILFNENDTLIKKEKINKFSSLIASNKICNQNDDYAMRFDTYSNYTKLSSEDNNLGFFPFLMSNDSKKNEMFAKVDAAIVVFADSEIKLQNAGIEFISWLKTNNAGQNICLATIK